MDLKIKFCLKKNLGLTPDQVNIPITLSRVAALPMPLVIGWVADRFSLKTVPATMPGLNAFLVGAGRMPHLIGILFYRY
jgi:sugar phosphate permease